MPCLTFCLFFQKLYKKHDPAFSFSPLLQNLFVSLATLTLCFDELGHGYVVPSTTLLSCHSCLCAGAEVLSFLNLNFGGSGFGVSVRLTLVLHSLLYKEAT